MRSKTFAASLVLFGAAALSAQAPNPASSTAASAPAADDPKAPIYRVDVVSRTTQAVNYGHRGAPTAIDFAGTLLSPDTKGAARILPRQGVVEVRARFDNLPAPQRYGTQYLTYVLWAVTPEGRTASLAELTPDAKGSVRANLTTDLQTFALIVTAEPYFAVSQPSNVVVAENVVRRDTLGRTQPVEAKYELLDRGPYTFDLEAAREFDRRDAPKVSRKVYDSLVAIYQARQAVAVAQSAGAAEHAAETLEKARIRLADAENYYGKQPKSPHVATLAREAAQMAEDARLIALRARPADE